MVTDGVLTIGQHIVVGNWEEPLQKALGGRLASAGESVLEIGFGLGLASRTITSLQPKTHWIIEAHEEVFVNALHMHSNKSNTILIHGLWEETVPRIASSSFSSILFDPYPFDGTVFDGSLTATWTMIKPFLDHASRLLMPSGVIGFVDFSDQMDAYRHLIKSEGMPFELSEYKRFPIAPDAGCPYSSSHTCNYVILTKVETALC